MIIDDLDPLRAVDCPNEADPELIVDPDGMLALSIALQGLQPVGRRRSEIVQHGGGVQISELSSCNLDQIGRKALRGSSLENCLGQLVFEAPDHARIIA